MPGPRMRHNRMTNSLGGRGRLGADLPVRMSAVRLENPRVPGIDRPIGHVACGRARQLAAQGAALILRTAQLDNVTRAWWWAGLVRTPVSVVSGGTCQEAPTEHMARAKWPNWYFDLQFLGFTCAHCPAVTAALDAVLEAYHSTAAVWWDHQLGRLRLYPTGPALTRSAAQRRSRE